MGAEIPLEGKEKEMRRQVERTPAKRFVITQYVGRSSSGVSLMAVISRSYETREEAEEELCKLIKECGS